MMEEDPDFQEEDKDTNIELTKEFKDKIKNGKCEVCSIVDVLSFFKNDEQKGIKDFENDTVRQTKEYLLAFNRYGVSTTNSSNIPFKLRKVLDYDKKIFSLSELALLLDLAPSNAEEAFSLIPSLKKKLKAEEMTDYLDKLNKEIINN